LNLKKLPWGDTPDPAGRGPLRGREGRAGGWGKGGKEGRMVKRKGREREDRGKGGKEKGGKRGRGTCPSRFSTLFTPLPSDLS
jgi:hypothetical protein